MAESVGCYDKLVRSGLEYHWELHIVAGRQRLYGPD